MSVNRATLSAATDAEAAGGDQVDLTITPPAAGDYDHTQVEYRKPLTETSWTTGPTYTGAQGVEGSKSVTGLDPNDLYEFVVYAVDSGGVVGPPSVSHRAYPTTGAGSVVERITADIKTAMEQITSGNGYFDDVVAVVRGAPTPTAGKSRGWPLIFVDLERGSNEERYVTGNPPRQRATLPFKLWAVSEAYGGEDWPSQEALRWHNAIVQAVMVSPKRGGLACQTLPRGFETFHGDDDGPMRHMSGIVVEVEVETRWRRNNPSQPT